MKLGCELVSISPMTTTWQTKAESLAKDYFKKVKAKGATLIVLSVYGDLVFRAGKEITVDATSLGSLSASLLAAGESLANLVKGSAHPIQFGTESKSFWMDRLGEHWIIFGVRCAPHPKHLKGFTKQLQKVLSQSTRKRTAEAFDGLSAEGIESHLAERMSDKRS